MKIAHLSDLHFTTFFNKNNLQEIDFALSFVTKNKIDHLVITGDLTDNASPQDFEILRNLFKKHNLLDGERLSIVIGNHDIFGGVQTAEDIFNFPAKCRSIDFNKKIIEFYDYFNETFRNCVYIQPERIFPYAKILSGILLIGLNSISEYSKTKNIFASNGSIKYDQLFELIHIFNDYKNNYQSIIILTHHHFNKIKVDKNSSSNNFWQKIEKQTMKLRKKERIINFFKAYNVDLVMHGHYHENKKYIRKGIKFLTAGGSFMGSTLSKIKINIVTLNSKDLKCEILTLQRNTDILDHRNISLTFTGT